MRTREPNPRSKKRRRRGETGGNEGIISKKKKHVKPKFTTFPPEIRNMIYHMVLVPDLDDAHHGHVTSLAQPGLTRTSRQIRKETLPIFYGKNHFVIRVPPTKNRAWDVPRTDRVTRSLTRRRAEYQDWEQPRSGGEPRHEHAFLTWMHPQGWGQFLYTLNVMIAGGPASAGGPDGAFGLMPFLTALYQHPLSLPSEEPETSLWHYNVGFTAMAPGLVEDHAFFRPLLTPARMLDARHNVTRFGSPPHAERDLAELMYALVRRRRRAAWWSYGDEPCDWEGDRTFGNLLAAMTRLMELCPRLREFCYLRVDRGAVGATWRPVSIKTLTALEPRSCVGPGAGSA